MGNSKKNCYAHLVLASINSGADASINVNGCERLRIQEANGEKKKTFLEHLGTSKRALTKRLRYVNRQVKTWDLL